MSVMKIKHISLTLKVRLYESLHSSVNNALQCATVLSVCHTTEQVGSSTSQISQSILDISWKDNICNEEVIEKRALQKLELIMNERRLRCFKHVLQMDNDRLLRRPRCFKHILQMDNDRLLRRLRCFKHILQMDNDRLTMIDF